jgi:hypothetical protein
VCAWEGDSSVEEGDMQRERERAVPEVVVKK